MTTRKLHLLPALALVVAVAMAIPNALAQEGDSRSGNVVHSSLVQDNRDQDRDSRSGRSSGRQRTEDAPAAAGESGGEQASAPSAPQPAAPAAPQAAGGTQSTAIQGIPAGLAGNNDEGVDGSPSESAANRRVSVDLLPGRADPNMAVLFLDPPFVSTVEGNAFTTQVALSNPSAREYQVAMISMHYNTAAIEPIDFPSTHLTESAADFQMAHDPERGIIQFLLQFDEPRSDIWVPIVQIEWEARREVRSTSIAFLNDDMTPTFVGYAGGRSILGNRTRDVPGVISTRVEVTPNLESVTQNLAEHRGVTLPWVVTGHAEEIPSGGVTLSLRPRADMVPVGGVVDVDVMIDNEQAETADEVDFRVLFDPEVLEVVDTHDDNWIEQGINIWDGAYHRSYPFDIHIRNQANNQQGTIDYRMGFTDQIPLASGTVATIRFRALRATNTIDLEFDPEETAVKLLGEDLLGDPEDPEDGVQSAQLSVVGGAVTAARQPSEPIS